MGNKSKDSPSNNEYITEEGYSVKRDGHSDEWFETFTTKMETWTDWGEGSPDKEMSEEEIQYIRDNMEDSENNPDIPSGHLTRVEDGYHIMPLIESGELKVGDTLPSNTNFRSYSKTQIGTLNASVFKGYNEVEGGRQIVIFRTNGNVKQFDVNKMVRGIAVERESLIDPTTLKIDKITTFKPEQSEYTGDFTHNSLYKELGVIDYEGVEDVNLYGNNEVILIDVSQAK